MNSLKKWFSVLLCALCTLLLPAAAFADEIAPPTGDCGLPLWIPIALVAAAVLIVIIIIVMKHQEKK